MSLYMKKNSIALRRCRSQELIIKALLTMSLGGTPMVSVSPFFAACASEYGLNWKIHCRYSNLR
jgi:hypothetical protein